MCTTKDGTKQLKNFSRKHLEGSHLDAMVSFNTDHVLYKRNDYRCLKPSKTKSPEDWPYYEMRGFRAAKSHKELESVKEIKYDKYFFNFEDPKILRDMTIGKRAKQLWKKTYGFDFVSLNKDSNQPSLDSECFQYCYRQEYGKFAKKCKKIGGIFKCCYTM